MPGRKKWGWSRVSAADSLTVNGVRVDKSKKGMPWNALAYAILHITHQKITLWRVSFLPVPSFPSKPPSTIERGWIWQSPHKAAHILPHYLLSFHHHNPQKMTPSEPRIPFAHPNLPSPEDYQKRKVALISGNQYTPDMYFNVWLIVCWPGITGQDGSYLWVLII
jgi:hypothetical protein